MPLNNNTYYLAGGDGANQDDAQNQLTTGAGNTEQTLVLDVDCTALYLSARTANAYVTFNNTVAASTNGIEILSGAQPVFFPIGYQAHGAHTLRYIGQAANCVLNVLQLR